MLNVNEKNPISTRALAKLVELTDERVRQLEDEGVFESETKSGKKYFDLTESINSYVEYLKNKLSDSASADTMEEIAKADLRYKMARADKLELELSELRGQMHRSEDVEEITSSIIANVRSELLSIPGRAAVDAEKKTAAEVSAVIKRVVDEILNDLANYGYDEKEYRKLIIEREKWLSLQEAQKEQEKEKKAVSKKRPQTSSKTSAKASKRRKT